MGIVPSGGSNTTFLRGDGTWVTPQNYYVTGAAFNTTTGVLSITGNNAVVGDTVDLDGRYLTGNQTITLTGDVTGSGTTSIATTIAADAVEAGMLNNNVISGQTELTSTPAGGDEILISDGGIIKRISYTNLIAGADAGVTTVTASTANDLDGLSATPTSGAVVVGLDIDGLSELTGVTPATAEIPIYFPSTDSNKKVTAENLAARASIYYIDNNTHNEVIVSGSTSKKFTHTLGIHTIAQLVGATSGSTVYADVVRNPDNDNANEVEVTFGSATTENILCYLTKIKTNPS